MKRFATITVIGKDRSGVVARVTGFLFEHNANIEALEEQVTRGRFSMTIQASWRDAQFSPEVVRSGLVELGRSLGMEVRALFTEPHRKQRGAILVTRESHCLEALMKAFRKGNLAQAEPCLVISNRPNLKSLAAEFGLRFVHVPWNDRKRAELRVLKLLEQDEIDFVVLARFMKILSPDFVWRYKHKIINVHPSLLPSFPGPQAYRQAYEHGVKIMGATAHFVSMHLDEGPIIAQESFHVRSGMKLPDIVAHGQALESKVLVRAVSLFLRKRLDVYWGIVKEI